MLPRAYRLTRSEQFRTTIKNGRRAGGRLLVTHWVSDETATLQVGFVVSRAVGGSVVRSRVKRRLRELCRARIGGILPGRGSLVVRALPGAGAADSASLGRELDACLGRVLA